MIDFRLWIELRIPVRLYNFSVQNIVTATTWPRQLNLDKLYSKLQEQAKYEPDLFPGLIWKLPDISQQLFVSGNINFVGARSEAFPIAALIHIAPYLQTCSVHEFHPSVENPPQHPLLLRKSVQAVVQYHASCVATFASAGGVGTVQILGMQREHYKKNKKMPPGSGPPPKLVTKNRLIEWKALKSAKDDLTKALAKTRKSAASSNLFDLLECFGDLDNDDNNNNEEALEAAENKAPKSAKRKRDETSRKHFGIIEKRIRALPPEIVADDSVFQYQVLVHLSPTRSQHYRVRVGFDASIAVLDADSLESARHAMHAMESVLGLLFVH